MDILTSLSIVAFAALIHASFQLSVSVLTLLSGHAIGSKKSNARILHLTSSYTIGVAVMTLFILSFISIIFIHTIGTTVPLLAWALVSG